MKVAVIEKDPSGTCTHQAASRQALLENAEATRNPSFEGIRINVDGVNGLQGGAGSKAGRRRQECQGHQFLFKKTKSIERLRRSQAEMSKSAISSEAERQKHILAMGSVEGSPAIKARQADRNSDHILLAAGVPNRCWSSAPAQWMRVASIFPASGRRRRSSSLPQLLPIEDEEVARDSPAVQEERHRTFYTDAKVESPEVTTRA